MTCRTDQTCQTYLIKLGELTLKGGNRAGFEKQLRRNLVTMLRARVPGARLRTNNGRFYLTLEQMPEAAGGAGETDSREAAVEAVLSRLTGISGWAKTRVCEKSAGAVIASCVEEARMLLSRGVGTFKAEARRTDKSFPLTSHEICCAAGDAVTGAFPALSVKIKNPQAVITIEIREKAYVYSVNTKGLGGLPAGSAGRGLLLLSGGIDSPVAGCLMAGRGMGVDGVYFHTPPYTSPQALEKTTRLAELTGAYAMGMRLWVVNFTEVQKRIGERGPPAWSTVLLRMAMMEAASSLARKRKASCLITGESLSQVASQTIENLSCTQSRASLPVLRPLIGMDKERITTLAKSFGTYETSILPYPDCCVLFRAEHPILRGKVQEAAALYESLCLPPLIDEAVQSAGVRKCGYYESL
ncbi:MAG: tRNA 4-thiouridine(8) synthase ThiI [Treponema sp.]|jgi:thiamine biosynthesis protein ThiI|nr:tRNA 4-thiouridine(8) synthase ThiI [Treponema sp.]